MRLYLHLSFFLLIAYAYGETVFKQEPKDDAGVPGDDVDMDCVIEDYYVNTPVSYTVIWYRNNVQFLPELDENFDYINNDPTDTGDFSLRIFDIDVSQRDGTYYCRYNSGLATSDSSTAEVVVAVSATLSMTFNDADVTEDNEVTVKAEDSSEEFKCEAKDGNPEPVISWFVDSKNITDSSVQENETSTLNHTFEPGDNEAILQCRVFTHELLETQFLNKTLDVQYFIEDFDIEILHDGADTIVIGDKLELECAADGNPEPVYTWSKDTNALQETSRILKKDSVTLEDEGLYKCEASNDIGEGFAELQITVNEKTNVAMIVGLTFGVLVLVIIIIAIFAFVKKIWCFKRMAPTKPDEEQTGGPNSYVMNPQPTHYPDNSAMRQRGEFEDTANLYAKPDKTKKKESQKHPVAQEFEAVYKKDAPSQKARPAPNPNNVEGLTYADLDLIKTGQSGLPPREEESTVYSQIKPSVRV